MIKKISVLFIAALLVLTLTSITTYAAVTDIDGPSVIHKEKNQLFTVNDLLSLYDYDVFIETDEFTGYGNIPGEYHVLLFKGDITKDVTIVVVENWGNLEDSTDVLFVADFMDIYVSNDRQLTLYEIFAYIYTETGVMSFSQGVGYEEYTNTYHSSFEDGEIPEGVYDLNFKLTYTNGYQEVYDVEIHTFEIIQSGIFIEAPPSTIERIISFFPYVIGIVIVVYALKHIKKKRGYNI